MKNTNLLSKLYWDTYSLAYELVDNLQPHKEIITITSSILTQNSPKRILDAGCGTGNLIALLNNELKNVEIYGIDISPSMLRHVAEKVKQSVNKNQIKLFSYDVNKGLPFPSNFFDGIACIHVINYLYNPNFICREFVRSLKKDGNLVIVSFKKKLFFKKLKNYHSQLIKEYCTYKPIKSLLLLPTYLLLTLCNLPIKVGYGVKYYDEKAINEFIGNKLKKIESKDVFLGSSILIHYKKC